MGIKRKGWFRRPRIPEVFPNYGPGKCLFCGGPLPLRKRKFCTYGCGTEYRIATARYELVTWDDIRREAFKRDNYTCTDCHKKFYECEIEGHHKVPIFAGGSEFDVNNVETLCHDCHRNRKGKEILYLKNKKIEEYSGGK